MSEQSQKRSEWYSIKERLKRNVPFFDIFNIGEGEEALPECLRAIRRLRAEGACRADILRAHHDLASLLAREHELLTSHGHGRVFEGLPTLDTIAERLSAEAASGHIDARIVDAAHLLADKTYGDEVDPSELTPRERRRLERAKLAVREYRRRMLELYAREEAEDDDGR